MSRFKEPCFNTYEEWTKDLKEGVVVPQIAKDFIEGTMTNVPVPELDYFVKEDRANLRYAASVFYDSNSYSMYNGPDDDDAFYEWYEKVYAEGLFSKMGEKFAAEFDYSGVVVPDLPDVYWQAKHFVDTTREWAKNATYIKGMDPIKKCALSLCLDGCRNDGGEYNEDPNIPVDMAKMIMYNLPMDPPYCDPGSQVWPNMFEKGYTKSLGPGWSMRYLANMCINVWGVPHKDDKSIFKTIFEEGERLYGKEWADIARDGYRARAKHLQTFIV